MHVNRWIGLGLAALAAGLPGAARAQVGALVTPTVAPFAGGQATFSYTLTDTGSSPLGDFLLNVPASVTLTNETAPSGWQIFYTPSADVIEWASTDPSTDIAAGSSLSGFGFDAPLPAGPEGYEVRSFDDDTTAGGTTLGPTAPVPEASSVISLGLLLLLGGAVTARRKAGD